jgi:hypothetical protein
MSRKKKIFEDENGTYVLSRGEKVYVRKILVDEFDFIDEPETLNEIDSSDIS